MFTDEITSKTATSQNGHNQANYSRLVDNGSSMT